MPRVPANQDNLFGPKTAVEQGGGFRFLELPAEIRVMCYQYLLPTVDEPHLLVYNPLVDTQKQTFLSLWRTCKTIYNEQPTISSLLSAGAIIPTVEVGKRTLSSTGPWEEDSSERTSPAHWESILTYLKPYLPEARYLHIRYTGLGDDVWWLEGWKNSEIARSAMHEWLWVHFDDFSEVVDENEEEADGHPSQGKTLLLDLEIANCVHIPYLYVSLLEHAVFNLDAITLPKVELLEAEASQATAGKVAHEQNAKYNEERDREHYRSTLKFLNEEEMQNLEKLKSMHEDFVSSGFELFSVNFHKYGRFSGIAAKWSDNRRLFGREYEVAL
ncbi:hypothetical protein MMC10_004627 [Thelotrema lepadinum]|nr:hypothetical protein [Thelotrema lepadinum]